jgi:hypothetical protein
MHSLTERDCVLGGDDQEIMKEEVKTNLMAPTLPLNSPTFFPSLGNHVYNLPAEQVVFPLSFAVVPLSISVVT